MGEDKGAALEDTFGAQQAAKFLGVHRSTVYLAVRRGMLKPDINTPGHHARFKRSTLEAFAEYLKHDSATSERTIAGPLEMLRGITRAITRREDTSAICQSTVDGICSSQAGIDMAAISRLVRTHDGKDEIQSVAQSGFPAYILEEFNRLREERSHAFTVYEVLDLHRERVVADTEAEPLPYMTAKLVRRAKVRSFAALPVVADGRTVGLVHVASFAPRQLSKTEREFLRAVSDQVALLLRIDGYLSAMREMQMYALDFRAQQAGRPDPDDDRALRDLEAIFMHDTGAVATWVQGICGACDSSATATARERHLARLSKRIQNVTGEVLDAQWRENGRRYTAIATSLPVGPNKRGAVGAIWEGERLRSSSDYSLLLTFGTTVLLAYSGRDADTDSPAGAEGATHPPSGHDATP